MGLMAAITKGQHSVKHVVRIPELFAMTYWHAVSEPTGLVFLELPIDVLFQRVETGTGRLTRTEGVFYNASTSVDLCRCSYPSLSTNGFNGRRPRAGR